MKPEYRTALLIAGATAAGVYLVTRGAGGATYRGTVPGIRGFDEASLVPATERSYGTINPRGPEYQVKPLPGRWPQHWEGRCDFVRYMTALFGQLGLNQRSAALLTGKVIREVGWGTGVWNNAFGNVKAYGDLPWHRLSDGLPYRSFPTARDGARYLIEFLRDGRENRGQYKPAWQKLAAGDLTWYGDVGRAGYYEGNPTLAQQEYNAIVNLMATRCGVRL